ncbi:MAG: ECF transporter S component [Clostridiales bacterium]|nr:ECF transporter S component [Clostridiales bacterium]
MKTNTKKLVGVGVLTAIVIVLQFLASAIKFGPFSITLVLAPIVVGAALYGKWSGAWLGAVFGVSVLISGDAAVFLTINPVGTVITVLLKGCLAGLAAGLVYSLIEKKNKLIAVITAGIVCPVVNTGVFLIGCCLFFMDTITEWAGGTNVGVYMITGLVGLNFVVELAINLVLATVVERIINIGKKTV